MTGINVHTKNFLWLAALMAATILVAMSATSSAYAATGEYGLQIPGGGNTTAPPLDPGGAAPAPSAAAAPTGTAAPATGEVVEGNGKSKKKGKGKSKGKDKKKAERKLPELGPAKPPTIAAPVSAVARGTTPGIVPLAAVLAGLLVVALVGRRLIRNQAA